MARKSTAALSVVRGAPTDTWMPPPPDLTATEQELWNRVVRSKPADWFSDDSAPLLAEYVRSAVACDRLAAWVEMAFNDGDADSLKAALDMRDKESRRTANLATKLRLTQQSRYTPQAAATANRSVTGRRPWQTGA
jgi:hypothetical protein